MNIHNIKKDFAIFDTYPELIYLDSTATSLTPRAVIDAVTSYYIKYDANIARGVYKTSAEATDLCELSRKSVADFLSTHEDEVVFTSGTTASLNMIAHGIAHILSTGDTIITTKAEHHANFVPWQIIAKEKNAKFLPLDITASGHIDRDLLLESIDDTTKIIALSHISNVLGTINPIRELIQEIRAKKSDVIIVIDAAQSASHMSLNVTDIDCDFLAFSLHKTFGPTGTGILYGKKKQLEKLTPLFTGGEMIDQVTSICTEFRDIPHRLEAGTPNIAGIIATKEALNYIAKIGIANIQAHEKDLIKYTVEKLTDIFDKDIKIYGPENINERSSIISFTFKNYHPHDIASILDAKKSIAVRAGQHCAMPLHMESLDVPATTRMSLSLYNSREDIDIFIAGLKEVEKTLK